MKLRKRIAERALELKWYGEQSQKPRPNWLSSRRECKAQGRLRLAGSALPQKRNPKSRVRAPGVSIGWTAGHRGRWGPPNSIYRQRLRAANNASTGRRYLYPYEV
jgi:hypothetical protein